MAEISKKNLEKIKETISKILDLADGTTFEGEAAVAMSKAKKLLDRYGLKIEDIQALKKAGRTGIVEIVSSYSTLPRQIWEVELSIYIARFFSCQHLNARKLMWFVGYPQDAEMAAYLFEQVRNRLREIAAEATHEYVEEFKILYGVSPRFISGPHNFKVWRNSFLVGMTHGIGEQLVHEVQKNQPTPDATSLVLVKERDIQNHLETEHPGIPRHKLETYADFNPSAYGQGLEEGRGFEIRKGLPK